MGSIVRGSGSRCLVCVFVLRSVDIAGRFGDGVQVVPVDLLSIGLKNNSVSNTTQSYMTNSPLTIRSGTG
jgi:hypothetical protein